MVIVNYELFLAERIQQQLQQCQQSQIKVSLASEELRRLIIKLYEYCEELNIIKRRVEKLKFYTDRNEVIMPKLIDSEITRIDAKAKEISTAYSLFLFKQKKFKVLSNQSKFFEALLTIIIRIVVEKCFQKEDSEHLTKEVNRLFRTNTFNSQCCWKSYLQTMKDTSYKKQKLAETNFRVFRRSVYSQSSQIKPYVNNKTCFKSLKSRSPIISLWHPNNEYLSFSLQKDKMKRKFQL